MCILGLLGKWALRWFKGLCKNKLTFCVLLVINQPSIYLSIYQLSILQLVSAKGTEGILPSAHMNIKLSFGLMTIIISMCWGYL